MLLRDLFAAIAKMLHDSTATILQDLAANMGPAERRAVIIETDTGTKILAEAVDGLEFGPAREREILELVRLLRE